MKFLHPKSFFQSLILKIKVAFYLERIIFIQVNRYCGNKMEKVQIDEKNEVQQGEIEYLIF